MFTCNLYELAENPLRWGYARDLHRTAGFGDTVDFEHIERHCCQVLTGVNPNGIRPARTRLRDLADTTPQGGTGRPTVRRRRPSGPVPAAEEVPPAGPLSAASPALPAGIVAGAAPAARTSGRRQHVSSPAHAGLGPVTEHARGARLRSGVSTHHHCTCDAHGSMARADDFIS